MKKLELEFRNAFKKAQDSFTIGNVTILMTPPIDEDYWVFRIKMSENQSIVAFPKFGTLGIGFAVEEDWNTNLPYQCDTRQIFNHIKRNKGNDEIRDKDCLIAIAMLQKACKYYKENEMPVEVKSGNDAEFNLYFKRLKTLVMSN